MKTTVILTNQYKHKDLKFINIFGINACYYLKPKAFIFTIMLLGVSLHLNINFTNPEKKHDIYVPKVIKTSGYKSPKVLETKIKAHRPDIIKQYQYEKNKKLQQQASRHI